MPTYRENKEFKDAIISDTILDDVLSWVETNKEPDEIYRRDWLKEWAMDEFDLVERQDS